MKGCVLRNLGLCGRKMGVRSGTLASAGARGACMHAPFGARSWKASTATACLRASWCILERPPTESAKMPLPMGGITQTRDDLVSALETDLIGPFEDEEALRLPPSRWYLTGFLAAMEARLLAEPKDDELAAGSDVDAEEAGPAEGGPKSRHFLLASLGLSVLLPPATGMEDSGTCRGEPVAVRLPRLASRVAASLRSFRQQKAEYQD